jgi:hypothetical protein
LPGAEQLHAKPIMLSALAQRAADPGAEREPELRRHERPRWQRSLAGLTAGTSSAAMLTGMAPASPATRAFRAAAGSSAGKRMCRPADIRPRRRPLIAGGMAAGRQSGPPALPSDIRQLLPGGIAVRVTFIAGSLIGSYVSR